MNESREFVIEQLNKLFLQLDEVEIFYRYDKKKGLHIIKVQPEEIFSESVQYIEMEESLEANFIEKFPEEEILFIGQDSLIEIGNPDKVFSSVIDYDDLEAFIPSELENLPQFSMHIKMQMDFNWKVESSSFKINDFGRFDFDSNDFEPEPDSDRYSLAA